MKQAILNEVKKEDRIRKFLEQRIQDNRELFTEYELKLIKDNISVMKKIYILGLVDSE